MISVVIDTGVKGNQVQNLNSARYCKLRFRKNDKTTVKQILGNKETVYGKVFFWE